MESTTSSRKMRSNFMQIKEELKAAMLLCIPSYDQYNRVMLTLSELLVEAIDGVHRRKPFKPVALSAAFEVIDTCKTDSDQQVVLLKFARSFVLFIETLNAMGTFTDVEEYAPPETRTHYQHMLLKPRMRANETTSDQGEHLIFDLLFIRAREKRYRRLFISHTLSYYKTGPFKRPRLSPPQQNRTITPMNNLPSANASFTDNPLFEDSKSSIGEPSTSSQCGNAPGDAGTIKEEEINYDYGAWNSAHQAQLHNQINDYNGTEIKEEEIKEEPLEAPIVDKIIIGSGPSTSHIVDHPSCSNGKIRVQANATCPYCDEEKERNKLEIHIKSFHKKKWLRHVFKCPEEECDFRSQYPALINKHLQEMHTAEFRKWRLTLRDIFIVLTHCPYCPRKMTRVAQFIDHMESDHPRLCTYQTPILKCNSCPFTAMRCWQMFKHWFERGQLCPLGMRFLYETAAKITILDKKKEMDEALRSTSPEPARKTSR